ncbi:MAG: HyaD/HybD family hydrogenase maturation endopeptidase [Magnetococcales bacterium]|nr:HyaD/HybD family hydrogenase maturation endopeptidase [Magnetococcales bacterium]
MGVVVLGIGNLLMSDDGVGVRLLQWMEEHFAPHPEVVLLDGGTAGLALLPRLVGAEALLILDAVRSDHPPGTVIFLEGKAVPARFTAGLTPHQSGVADLMAAMLLEGSLPPHAAVVGVVPQRVSLGWELSPAVASSLPEAAARAVSWLDELGWTLAPVGSQP